MRPSLYLLHSTAATAAPLRAVMTLRKKCKDSAQSSVHSHKAIKIVLAKSAIKGIGASVKQ
jgi:hypothetical protein